ncbi:MAG TPA: DNA polymerase III subunit delta [Bacteroidetes bacterium]|nr:DNA polymerase III subunit delta [Bacteroidota bacterium]
MKKDFASTLKEIKSKIFHPIYFLEGDEPYYIDLLSSYIEDHALSDSEKSFNQHVIYGKDVTPLQIRELASGYPMLGNYQVIIVKEAQSIRADAWEPMEHYLQKPLKTTILVICHKYKSIDKRTRFGKMITEHTVHLVSKKIYESELPDWILRYAHEEKLKLTEEAAMLLAEFIGNDLSRIASELKKLLINIPEGKTIDANDISSNIGMNREYNSFELNRALGEKNVLKANRIIQYFGSNQKANPMVMTLGTMFSYFQKIYVAHVSRATDKNAVAQAIGVSPYFAGEYLTAMRNFPLPKVEYVLQTISEYDLKSKGVNIANNDSGELLRELIYKILH